ncbi:hypothetical protein KUTeg_003244 [Tegillarca granosa]|uniref:Uncharacterized protein n=1 Tax=Tegillarca granosa TaxID=220873 RepID=A0ABQ9FLJ9_TEGGR|nr:hypothetical protein KUTeg_003244 [Tegillarca granosa]
MELYFKVLGLWLVAILTNMATSAEGLVCGNKGTPCGTNSFCDGSTCRSCKLITDYCFRAMMPPECMDFCRAHLRNQEEIKCENKLKNLTETLEKANTETTSIPDILNKTMDIHFGNLQEYSYTMIMIAMCVVCTLIISGLILYILHLRRRIAYLNKNNIQDDERIRFLNTNNNDDNNNDNDNNIDNDRDAVENNIADGGNPTNVGVQDNEPHSPEQDECLKYQLV